MRIDTRLFADSLRVTGFLFIVGFLVLDPLGIVAGDLFAAEGTKPPQSVGDYQGVMNTLGMIFILALLIEIGLAVLFDWRVFLRLAEGKGLKVPIAFAVSFVIVWAHGIDVPGEVVTAFQGQPAVPGLTGYVISALIIAGGSSSVNGIFEKLGWRNPVVQAKKAEAEREKTKGRVWVTVDRPSGQSSHGQPATVAIDSAVVGVLPPGEQTFGGKDGHPVEPGERTVKVTWADSSGASHEKEEKKTVAAGQSIGVTLTLA